MVRDVPSYHKAVLEDIDLQQKRNGKGSDPARDIQDLLAGLCTEIVKYEGQGLMQDTAFAVDAVRWGRFSNIHPSWEDLDVCEVYLGYAQQLWKTWKKVWKTVMTAMTVMSVIDSDDSVEDSGDSVRECSAQRF